ncbi:hypothetical protein [Lactobacillus crispatus]|uniref:Lipoprotein n=1 Tax=Lactobacillus crispatus TaxID=47770 RepID=A0ABV2B6Y8_9LACO|nr:hypothetical protein [Lactobacillus crispatus]STX17942.1 Uncharacterised protein [Lactobacillus acidophilus]EEU28437.1 hypothetical protein HMPREF0507_01335 [Lactobacillus crispatus MV-1A-US]EEX29337.1 hypothetical protein HMPREF0508_01099 [Lactobacillus crispatus MV-3A-US]KWU05998.1 hypothetical protein AEL96_05765 [Lactobacillus crispatus]MBG0732302.1 hypothetical protein [Lactobacillus crispatus]
MKKSIIAGLASVALMGAIGICSNTKQSTSPITPQTAEAAKLPKHFVYWLSPKKVIVTKNTKFNLIANNDSLSDNGVILTTKTLKKGRVVKIYHGVNGHQKWTFNPIPKDFAIPENVTKQYHWHEWLSKVSPNNTKWFVMYNKRNAKKYRKAIKKAKTAAKHHSKLKIATTPEKYDKRTLSATEVAYFNNPNISISDKLSKANTYSGALRDEAYKYAMDQLHQAESGTPY